MPGMGPCFFPEMKSPYIMELGNPVGEKACRRYSREKSKNSAHTRMGKIIRRGFEPQGQVHQQGEHDQGKKTDYHRPGGIFFSIVLTENIGHEKTGSIDDISKGRGDSKEFNSLRDLDICNYYRHGYPEVEAHPAPESVGKKYRPEVQQKQDYPQEFICHSLFSASRRVGYPPEVPR